MKKKKTYKKKKPSKKKRRKLTYAEKKKYSHMAGYSSGGDFLKAIKMLGGSTSGKLTHVPGMGAPHPAS